MTKEHDDDVGLLASRSDSVLWAVIVAALGLGGGSGLYTISSTQNRFTATDFRQEIKSRDVEIGYLKERVANQRETINILREQMQDHKEHDHPSQHVKERLDDQEKRLRDLERGK